MTRIRFKYSIPLYGRCGVYFENISLVGKWCIDSHSYWRCESFRKNQDIGYKEIIDIFMFVMCHQDFD